MCDLMQQTVIKLLASTVYSLMTLSKVVPVVRVLIHLVPLFSRSAHNAKHASEHPRGPTYRKNHIVLALTFMMI